jgi:protein-tyrosine-phosphatase
MKPFVLFVCRHNTGRSQMAEVYLRQLAGDSVEVASAGTIAADRPDPGVVALMAEDGVDISGARPKLLDPAVAERADRIITMGCDVEGVPRIDADLGVAGSEGTAARARPRDPQHGQAESVGFARDSRTGRMNTAIAPLLLLVAACLEVGGDAIVRVGLKTHSGVPQLACSLTTFSSAPRVIR